MDSLSILPVPHGSTFRILQLTDTHLFAGKHETLLGVNTWASFEAVLDTLLAGQQPFDAIVASGDLAQDHTPEAYQHFIEGISRLNKPCFWLPGNHDYQPTMVPMLAAGGVREEKHLLIGEQWQMLLLDSQVPGVPHGLLSDYQLEWLDNALARYPQRHALIFLHHHPRPSGCTWLDQHSLRNSHMLEAVLQKHPLAQTLVCGHIHQDLDMLWHGRRLLATPSTCVQFKPHCTNFTIDTVAPGWRWLTLGPQGELQTSVARLDGDRFTPDMDAEGY
ncbi:3',5'-cyclic-AMP phosphodiesterase [Pantoea sp. 1.19]|uniref:3',5'-cyclic-AMP phosphodiesterase n=1 Tax=Pantoea sp. 1.19 TaxID=1925589 RepID=UPI000948F67B|nr:3',5'-cyclic-AMP phosphodiesterase [Pantoea sp. 1.19]